MAARVRTGQRPDPAADSILNGGEVTSLIGLSGSASESAPGSAAPRPGARGAGSSMQREFARYVFAGGFSFVCDTGTLFALTQFLRVNYLISAAVGFTIGVGVNYLLCRRWVFQRRRLENTTVEMVLFVLIGVVGLGFNELILWTFQAKLGIYYMVAKVVSGVVVFVWNFGARKLALFR
ncbi:MAG: GtrA family protein [Acidobacteria bacterium]|nr:GtrA family protein [Acidobacteriota bacterium]